MAQSSSGPNVLFVSYNGLLEPILASQGIPYLEGLVAGGYRFALLTFEKKSDVERIGRSMIERQKRDLAARGIEWIPLRYHKRPMVVSTLYDIAVGSCHLMALVLGRGIRLVHVRGVTPGAMAIPLLFFRRAKVLFDMRGRLAEEMAAGNLWKTGSVQFRLIKAVERFLLERADAVTVLTYRHDSYNRGLDHFRGRKIPKAVIPCCVDLARFTCEGREQDRSREELGLEGRFVLMYQGKLGTFYFIDEMLDFYRRVLARRPDAVFAVVTPDDPAPLVAKAAGRGIGEEKLRVFRGVPYARMPRYMQAADAGVFFINALEKLGSSPIKMGEFLACGVPVVINPGVGDSDRIVEEERCGVVVETFDERAYDGAIERMLSLLGEGEGLRRRCREAARKHLSLEEGIARYAAIYKDLIPKP